MYIWFIFVYYDLDEMSTPFIILAVVTLLYFVALIIQYVYLCFGAVMKGNASMS